jgi:hypothetical protein
MSLTFWEYTGLVLTAIIAVAALVIDIIRDRR